MAEDTFVRSPLERLTLENQILQWQLDAAEADNADLRHEIRTLTMRMNERQEESAK